MSSRACFRNTWSCLWSSEKWAWSFLLSLVFEICECMGTCWWQQYWDWGSYLKGTVRFSEKSMSVEAKCFKILSYSAMQWWKWWRCLWWYSAANKYYSSVVTMNRKINSQINFSVEQRTKLVLQHSLCKNEFHVLVEVLPLHSFIYSISCLVK